LGGIATESSVAGGGPSRLPTLLAAQARAARIAGCRGGAGLAMSNRSQEPAGSLAILLCSFASQPELLRRVLQSIAAQTAIGKVDELVIVDNNPVRQLHDELVDDIILGAVPFRILHEPATGTLRARVCGLRAIDADWILQIDDDNEIPFDYVATGLDIIRANDRLGAFAGRLVLPEGIVPPRWMHDLLPYLAIRDYGDRPIFSRSPEWSQAEPPAAGAFCHSSVVRLFLQRVAYFEDLQIGAVGNTLLRGEDSMLFQCAADLDRVNAYYPQLRLTHHVDRNRFRFGYLLRLAHGYGRSHVRQERIRRSISEFERAQKDDLPLIRSPEPARAPLLSQPGTSALKEMLARSRIWIAGLARQPRRTLFMLFYLLGRWRELIAPSSYGSIRRTIAQTPS
jgi:glycosyltransferase involved in cell wall biosynthesis